MIDKWLFDILKITESTAIACYNWIGKGNDISADKSAVDVMRKELNKIAIDGEIVIGEGERDKAPMLYIGEKIGIGKEQIEIAVDPLEGTSICARADYGAMAVMAFSTKGSFLNAPDIYMEKIAIGAGFPNGIINISSGVRENLTNLADYKKCTTGELTVMMLNRKRHEEIISEIRKLGAKIKLIGDGDISAVIATSIPDNEVDMYLGTGGAPEGVLAASALKCIGGQMQTRLVFNDDEQILRAKEMGINDIKRIYNIDELVSDNVIFSATGVTDGLLVEGVKKHYNKKFVTETLLMSSAQKKTFKIKTSRY